MDTSTRAKRKHLELAQQGALVGTGRVFGYEDDRVTRKRMKPSSFGKRQPTSSRASHSMRLLDAGTEQGVKTPYGNIWRQAPLRQMMVSPRLAGYRVHQRAIALDTDGNPVMAQRPPILDVEVWRQYPPTSEIGRDRISTFTQGGGSDFLLASSAAGAVGPQ